MNLPIDMSVAGINDEDEFVHSLLLHKEPAFGREPVCLDSMAEVGTFSLSIFPILQMSFDVCFDD